MGKLETASKKCVTNYGFFIGATPENVSDLQDAVGTPEKPVAIPGICGIKIFMGASTGDLLVNDQEPLEDIFEKTAGLIAVHAEDENRMNERFKMMEGRTDMAAHAEWRDDITALHGNQESCRFSSKARSQATHSSSHKRNRGRVAGRNHCPSRKFQ